MVFHRRKTTLITAISLALLMSGCSSSDDPAPDPDPDTSFQRPNTYTGFPVTLANAPGSHTTSTSYAGQMTRHVLRDTVKAVVKVPGTTVEAETIALVNSYLKNTDGEIDDNHIVAPVTKGTFVIEETVFNQLGTNKNLYGKTYNYDASSPAEADPIPGVSTGDENITMGVPGNKSAREVLDLWLANYARNNANTNDVYVDMTNGYDYNQLFPKFLMGAVFYNQSVDKYLDEFIAKPGIKDNDAAYKDGKHYTGKEHSWDEGFGYWGAAANFGTLTAEQNYQIKKQKAEEFTNADWNNNASVSLYTEYTSGPAYYAASFDRDGNSTYGTTLMDAWLDGRTIIANAVDDNGDARKLTFTERTSLVTLAATIQDTWEMVLAEAVYKYAGNAHSTLTAALTDPTSDSLQKAYYKQWGELKGFMLSLQFGGKHSKINKSKFMEIDSLIGFGPVLANGDQVNDIDASGAFTRSTGNSTANYLAGLKAVQTTLDEFYTLSAKQSMIP